MARKFKIHVHFDAEIEGSIASNNMDLGFIFHLLLGNVFPLLTLAESVIAVEFLANWKAVVSMAVSTKLHCTQTQELQFILVQMQTDGGKLT